MRTPEADTWPAAALSVWLSDVAGHGASQRRSVGIASPLECFGRSRLLTGISLVLPVLHGKKQAEVLRDARALPGRAKRQRSSALRG